MSGDTGAGTTGWHDDEVVSAGLPDKRLARRFGRLLDQMSAAPGQPVPAACGDWAATKAAYRFFDKVITSVERRRRWSQGEKEQLVAASLEPGASVSEVARMAGLHVSQLFRWRKELCKHGEASIAPFVPVEIGPSVPPRELAEAPLTTTAARRRKSLGIIEIDLGSGHRIRVDGDVDGDALRRVLDALVRR